MEITSKIRIKDIAERAGVSVGTVDRIIHGRGNVSPISLERVQKVLDEINFTPNHYASALASHSVHQFAAILPMHELDSYWARVEKDWSMEYAVSTTLKFPSRFSDMTHSIRSPLN